MTFKHSLPLVTAVLLLAVPFGTSSAPSNDTIDGREALVERPSGWIYLFGASLEDSTFEPWEPECELPARLLYGQPGRQAPVVGRPGQGSVWYSFTPDSAFDMYLEAGSSTRRDFHVNVYRWSDSPIADASPIFFPKLETVDCILITASSEGGADGAGRFYVESGVEYLMQVVGPKSAGLVIFMDDLNPGSDPVRTVRDTTGFHDWI